MKLHFLVPVQSCKFLAPLAEGQQAIVMALCLSCVPSSVLVSVCSSLRWSVGKLFLQKTSPQKLLTRFLPNFTGKFLQIIVFH